MVAKVIAKLETQVETQVAILSAEQDSKPVFRTYEQICLDKLKEIGKASAKHWAYAMGYTNPNALRKVIRRITNDTPYLIKIHYERNPRLYEAI